MCNSLKTIEIASEYREKDRKGERFIYFIVDRLQRISVSIHNLGQQYYTRNDACQGMARTFV